jgi:DNA-binding NarL/FixJ family response regulator
LGCLPGQKPDLVLVDLELNQGPNGIEFLRTCRRRFPEVELLVLTIHDEAEWLFPALAAGASGYVIKGLANEKLLEAIMEVRQGGSFMSSSVARRMLDVFRRINQDQTQLDGLTTRETEVLRHLARGLRYDEIAAELKIGARTVNTHLHHIYRKLHVHSATGAVARYLKNQAPGER